jgi:SAM-dependent methyltransferase
MIQGNDMWLQRWLPMLSACSADAYVLELGCGGGRDSEVLAAAGHAVVGIDLSERSIAQARERVPSGIFHCQDVRAPFPLSPGAAGAVVASLSLHYFPWPETLALSNRIRETLRAGGLLLCRLNSTNDHHFGASGHPEIEPGYFLVDGEPKRFFDRAAVERLFDRDWRWISLEEKVIDRYDRPKSAWEAILETAG